MKPLSNCVTISNYKTNFKRPLLHVFSADLGACESLTAVLSSLSGWSTPESNSGVWNRTADKGEEPQRRLTPDKFNKSVTVWNMKWQLVLVFQVSVQYAKFTLSQCRFLCRSDLNTFGSSGGISRQSATCKRCLFQLFWLYGFYFACGPMQACKIVSKPYNFFNLSAIRMCLHGKISQQNTTKLR